MAKAGRKRKAGDRYASGDIKRPTAERLNAMAADLRQREQATVLMQPHRGGRACGSGPDPRRNVERTLSGGRIVETVADAPNIRAGRLGIDDKLAESPIGRLGMRHKLDEVLIAVGHEYANIHNRWGGSWGAPRGVGTPQAGRGGEGPTMKASERDRRLMVSMEQAMMREGGIEAVVAVKQLVFVIADTAPEQDHAAIVGLMALAVELGRWDKKRPYQ